MPSRSPELLLPNAIAWRQWLAREGRTTPVIWLVVAKKGGTEPKITYAEALDEALCHGWIDSGGCSRDETTRYLRFGPRKSKSPWSKRNIGYIERLEREGKMAEAGRAAVAQAKANGLWNAAYGAGDTPDDLKAAIDQEPRAQAAWDTLPKKDRYAIFVRLGSLPIPSTARETRVKTIVDQLLDHRRAVSSTANSGKSSSAVVELRVTDGPKVSLGTRSSKRLAQARSQEDRS